MHPSVFRTSYRVVWADTDAAQVVHYANYFRIFERAEEEFYRHLGFSFTEWSKSELWFPRVEAFCRYRKPAKFNELLQVEVTVRDLKEKSVRLEFRLLSEDADTLFASGYVIAVAADKKTGRATNIPVEVLEKLRSFSEQVN
jgi:acyl-CoA thioester hydrolase